MSDPDCSTSSSKPSNSCINSASENVHTKDLTEPTHQKPEINKELDDCIINGQYLSEFSGYPFDAITIDTMDIQELPTTRKSRYNEVSGSLHNRRLSQPLMGLVSPRSKDITPRRGTKNGGVKIVSDFMKTRRTSLPIVPSAGLDSIFQDTTEPNPKKVRKNGSFNNLISSHCASSPSSVDADCKKLKVSTPRKARRNGIINNILPDSNYYQPAPKPTDKASIYEEVEKSNLRNRTNGNLSESLAAPSLFQTSLQTSSVFEVSKNITPKKTKGNNMVNNNLSDTRSPHHTKELDISSTERTRSFSESVNGILLDPKLSKSPKKSTPRKIKRIGILNGTFTNESSSSQLALQTASEESVSKKPKVSTPSRKRGNRVINGDLLDIKDPKESTPRKAKSNGSVNGALNICKSSQSNSQRLGQSVSKVQKSKVSTPTRTKSSIVNGSLSDIKLSPPTLEKTSQASKENKRVTPKTTKSTRKPNGTLTDVCPPHPSLLLEHEVPVFEEPIDSSGILAESFLQISAQESSFEDPKQPTPRKTRSIGKVNGTLTDCKSSQSTPQRLGQDVCKVQKLKLSTPKRTNSRIVNGSLSDIELSQPTLGKTVQVSKENKRLSPRTTKSTGKMNGTLTNHCSPQPTLLSEQVVPVFEDATDSTEVRTESPSQISALFEDTKEPKSKSTRNNGKVNGILTDDLSFKSPSQSVANASTTEETKEPTPKRKRKNQMIHRILSHYQIPQFTSQTVAQSSISETMEELTPQTTRKNGSINGILHDFHTSPFISPTVAEESKESTLKRYNGSVNGILDDKKPSELILQTALLGTPDEKPHAVPLKKTPQNGVIRRKSSRTSVQIKAEKAVPIVETPKKIILGNPVVKLERLTFDANGLITWPSALKGKRVDMQQALEDLERCEEDLQRAERELYRKYRKPRNGKETYSKEYVVERIIDQEFDAETKTLMFRVKWEGYPLELSTWEPLDHLQHCTLLLTQFLAERLGVQVLDALCEKLNISSRLSDQNLLEILKVTDLSCLPDKILLQEKLLRLVATPPKERHVRKLEDGKKAMLMYQLLLRREQQLKKLKAWEDSINGMTKEEALITIENNVDLECPPEGFTYIHENIATNGIVIQSDPERFCDCEECGPRQECCGKQPYNGFTYKTSNKINVNPGNAVYECNKKCKCSQDCRNRVVQNGRKVPLCIFRTSNGCGWGVKTTRKIYCGEFVCEYVGEIITHEEAEVRGRAYDQDGRTYLFDLDYNSKDNPYTVDAAKFGNISHFINHSCDPNLGVYAVWIDCSDPNLPRLALFALREIQRDEEITFDYMMNIDPEVPTTPEKPRFLHTPDKNQLIQNGRNICKCEADACRRYLF